MNTRLSAGGSKRLEMMRSVVEGRKEGTEHEEEREDDAEGVIVMSEAVTGPPTVAILPTVRQQTGGTISVRVQPIPKYRYRYIGIS